MANEPIEASKHIQRAWDTPIITVAYNEILARCALPVDQARLEALTTRMLVIGLHAPSLTAMGLRLSDEAIRVATGFRLGTIICQPHICVCGTMVDARGLHSLASRKSAHVTYVTPSLTTLFGGRLRKHIFQPTKSRLDCLEVMVKDLMEQHWFLGRAGSL